MLSRLIVWADGAMVRSLSWIGWVCNGGRLNFNCQFSIANLVGLYVAGRRSALQAEGGEGFDDVEFPVAFDAFEGEENFLHVGITTIDFGAGDELCGGG